MSRINTPATVAESPESSQPILENVNKILGSVPNIFRLIGNSPAVLEGYVSLNGALTKGVAGTSDARENCHRHCQREWLQLLQ